jgi:hypothetical protein
MKLLLSLFLLFLMPLLLRSQEDLSLRYTGKATTALVGDGRFIVKVSADRFLAARGLILEGMFRFFRNKEELLPSSTLWNSTVFPGGASYDIRVGRDTIHITYGVLPETGFTVLVETSPLVETRLSSSQSNSLLRTEAMDAEKKRTVFRQKEGKQPALTASSFRQALEQPYRSKLVLHSPQPTLNKAVAFSQSLLDLSYNGELMYCELFRWLDIWARDLGSGLLPGALVSGREEMARKSLSYDLNRYATMRPEDCKNSNDPSQGGTASEVGWTMRSIWTWYQFSGNLDTLKKDAALMRPWVSFWIKRDYDEDGLITDVTDFMDHMIMMLSTNGVQTLASNAMYASMLNYAASIEAAIGNTKDAKKIQALYTRTVNALNTLYWNDDKGYFSNMLLWDGVCRRSSQASQAMLLKIGATDEQRSKRTLDFLKNYNWSDYGSVTIRPRMNHVGLDNDQNVRVWPWWNLWEAEARFRNKDTTGAWHLLDLAAATIEDEKYPGLIEETLDTTGISTGGNVFATAGGNLLETVVKDLLGVEAMTPGWMKIKVVPAVPSSWSSYDCSIPTPGGSLLLKYSEDVLHITVKDPRIKEVHVKDMAGVVVNGAEKRIWQTPAATSFNYQPVAKKMVAPMKQGKAVLFYDPHFHTVAPALNLEQVTIDQLEKLPGGSATKLVITGNRLPLFTYSGKSVKAILEKFVERGGTVVFYGATTNAKTDEDGAGILGEQCGIIDWYQYLAERTKTALSNWKKKEGSYTTSFLLPANYSKDPIYIELGPLAGLDSVFINNQPVANYRDMEPFIRQEYPTQTGYPDTHRYKMLSRLYSIKPGTAAWQAFRFNQQNSIRVKLMNDGLKMGIPEQNQANIGIMTTEKNWQPIDEALPNLGLSSPKRKGINYWGSEQFFNSWSTKNGLFGFTVEGAGISFGENTLLGGLEQVNIPVSNAYTDFSVFHPWNFEVLAYTTTNEHLLYPATTERYPCIARIVNTNGGGYLLITPAVVGQPIGETILKKLQIIP